MVVQMFARKLTLFDAVFLTSFSAGLLALPATLQLLILSPAQTVKLSRAEQMRLPSELVRLQVALIKLRSAIMQVLPRQAQAPQASVMRQIYLALQAPVPSQWVLPLRPKATTASPLAAATVFLRQQAPQEPKA